MNKTKFDKDFDYLFNQMYAQLPMTGVEWLRPAFKEWWKRMSKEVQRKWERKNAN